MLKWESLFIDFTPNNLKQFIIPNFQTLSSRKNLWNYDGKVSKVIGHATYSLKLILIRSRTSVGLWTYTHRLTKRRTSKRAKDPIWKPNLEKKTQRACWVKTVKNTSLLKRIELITLTWNYRQYGTKKCIQYKQRYYCFMPRHCTLIVWFLC